MYVYTLHVYLFEYYMYIYICICTHTYICILHSRTSKATSPASLLDRRANTCLVGSRIPSERLYRLWGASKSSGTGLQQVLNLKFYKPILNPKIETQDCMDPYRACLGRVQNQEFGLCSSSFVWLGRGGLRISCIGGLDVGSFGVLKLPFRF